MSKKLVIVESPAKARTINRYLGTEYEVLASYGHVRDLLPKEGAVDTEDSFAMHYEIIEKNAKSVDTITRAMKKADMLYLATDPDREGEAISWHLCELLKERNVLDGKNVYRVVFHEITQHAIDEAIQHPRQISMDLVNAQQARRALDYLVGFNLSPLLWKKIRRGLSAGRVQSPALRLIVEREEEIEKFKAREYWSIDADIKYQDVAFIAKLVRYQNEKLTQFTITTEDQAQSIKDLLWDAAKSGDSAERPTGKLIAHKIRVASVDRKQRKRNPVAPFTTSTLQQEAARTFGFTAQRTMRIAQQLYEGIEITDGSVGLVTYMRTDSVNLAHEALQELRAFIAGQYGFDKLPSHARKYKTKAKNAQEAHEAIRPTSVRRTPDQLKSQLTSDQLKLYALIWRRTVACQMIHATIDTMSIDLACGEGNIFRATGSTVVDPGFMMVYQEGGQDVKAQAEESMLPQLNVGDELELVAIRPEQHFTESPPRYTEATLVKSLEEYGIGRPSTYASIISTLQQREYVKLEKRRFRPTDIGRIVNRFLTEHFRDYVDYNFTARLEDELDAVSRGEKQWVPLLKEFWTTFKQLLDAKEETISRRDVTQELLDEACPKCGRKLAICLGRRGRFIGCTGFPDCDYTRNVEENKDKKTKPEIVEGRTCPNCNSSLIIREGRYGRFIGCSTYPECRYIEPLEKPEDTGVACPECNKGTMLKRRSKRGKTFYSCSTYPKCKFAVWNEPINAPCPVCNWPMLTIKTTKRRGAERVCPQKTCNFAEPYGHTKIRSGSR
ncbi:MAG: type I DNA topoisomerase [Gammaproteobacteria bacterium]|nr:type I DNA topoisomerase [Gammaproteobacteria bacterium]MCI0590581.1 type I DNA topoisomerase [Gammaproteobacteria bacterium]